MSLTRTEIVRELEDKIPCPSCGSYWMDPVILGKADWLIPAMGLQPRDPDHESGQQDRPTEQVRCHGCGAEPSIDVMAIVRAMGELDTDDEAELASLIIFKQELFGALLRGETVSTPFGLFFGQASASKLEPVEGLEGFVRLTTRRMLQFLPTDAFLREVCENPLAERQIRASMERAEAGGFWDIDRNDFCEIATGVTVPNPTRSLDVPGLYDDVVRDLRAKRSSPLRGLGTFVIRRVGRKEAPRELVSFSFWGGFAHVAEGARSRRNPEGGSGRSEQPEVVHVSLDHGRSARDPRRSSSGFRRGVAPSV
jgi:hypothetical protein